MGEPVTVEVVSGRMLWREQRLEELHADLRSAGVGAALHRPAGLPADGEKGVVESVALLLGAAAPIAGPLMETVRSIVNAWLARDPRTTMRLSRGDAHLEITGELDESQQRALERFLNDPAQPDDGSSS